MGGEERMIVERHKYHVYIKWLRTELTVKQKEASENAEPSFLATCNRPVPVIGVLLRRRLLPHLSPAERLQHLFLAPADKQMRRHAIVVALLPFFRLALALAPHVRIHIHHL